MLVIVSSIIESTHSGLLAEGLLAERENVVMTVVDR